MCSFSSLAKEQKDPIWARMQADLTSGRFDDELAKANDFRSASIVMMGIQKLNKGVSQLEKSTNKQQKREEKNHSKQVEKMASAVVQVEEEMSKSKEDQRREEMEEVSNLAELQSSANELVPFVLGDIQDLVSLALPHVDIIWFLDIHKLMHHGDLFIKKYMGPHSKYCLTFIFIVLG